VRWLVLFAVVFACNKDAPRKPSCTLVAAGPVAAAAPHRLVTLSPSATEIVAALGATASLVGVDDYSKYPPEVTQLPKVGSFLTPNLEQIVKLKPTLVIVDDVHKPVAAALRDAGLSAMVCPIHSLPDVKGALADVGAQLGKADVAKRVVDGIDTALDRVAAARPAKRPRVLAILDREAGGLGNLVAAGTGSWLDELLAIAGGENVLASAGVRYPKLSMEEVLRTKPDIVLDASFAARASTKEWTTVDIPAVKAGKVIVLREDYMIAPSPRVAQALETIAAALK
jgi:iron complex transport system substrate-binding protein